MTRIVRISWFDDVTKKKRERNPMYLIKFMSFSSSGELLPGESGSVHTFITIGLCRWLPVLCAWVYHQTIRPTILTEIKYALESRYQLFDVQLTFSRFMKYLSRTRDRSTAVVPIAFNGSMPNRGFFFCFLLVCSHCFCVLSLLSRADVRLEKLNDRRSRRLASVHWFMTWLSLKP